MPSTGTLGLGESTDITVVIGEGGAGGTGFTQGAKGANGYAKLTHQGIDYEYTTVGTHTVAVEKNYLAEYRNNEKNLKEITISDYISSGETFIISEDTWVWSDNTANAALTIDIPVLLSIEVRSLVVVVTVATKQALHLVVMAVMLSKLTLV